jgi:hypothetical protein
VITVSTQVSNLCGTVKLRARNTLYSFKLNVPSVSKLQIVTRNPTLDLKETKPRASNTCSVQKGSGAHPAYPMDTAGSFPVLKRPGREADHSGITTALPYIIISIKYPLHVNFL